MRENLPGIVPEIVPSLPDFVEVKPPGPIARGLYKAAAHMQRNGYMHEFETLYAPRGRACFIGTIEHALRFTPGTEAIEDYFQDLIFGKDTYNPFAEWNLERYGWNKEDAVAALQLAAEYAHAEGV